MGNANSDLVVLSALASVLAATPHTAFGQQNGSTYIEDEFDLLRGTFPALHLMSGTQEHLRTSQMTFEGTLNAIIKYYHRYDLQNATIDSVRRAINTDLNLMKDWLAGNDSLVVGNIEHSRSIARITLSPYKGNLEEIEGMKLVSRTMTAVVNLLEYDVP